MSDIIQTRRDTAANWTSANPTLADGEQGYETDTSRIKIGDGSTTWTGLAYYASEAAATATAADVVLTNADVVTTNADVVLTGLDVTATAADVVTTNADVVLTNADAATTTQDAIDTAADVVLTNADVVTTNADVVLTNADVVTTTALVASVNLPTIGVGDASKILEVNVAEDGYDLVVPSAGGGGIGEFIDTSIAISSDNTALANDDGTSNDNIALGEGALASSVSCSTQIAIGQFALNQTSSGASANTAIGAYSSYNLTTGDRNVAIGDRSCTNITTGLSNVGIGYYGLYGSAASKLTGSYNTGIGYQAGYSLTTGQHNVLNGYQAGYSLTTGSDNVLIGNSAGKLITSGIYNVAIGYNSMLGSATPSATYNNTAVGKNTLKFIDGGDGNVAIGDNAGESVTTGSASVFIGHYAGSTETASNKLHIANNATESLIEGDFSAKTLHINGAVSATSGLGSMELIQTQVVSSSVASVEFTGLSGYDALILVVTSVVTATNASIQILSSTDSGTTLDTGDTILIHGDTSTAESRQVIDDHATGVQFIRNNIDNTKGSSSIIYITGYDSDYSKLSFNSQGRNASNDLAYNNGQGLFNNTGAINLLRIRDFGSTVTIDSGTFSLYGVKS